MISSLLNISDSEYQQREALIAAARSWIGTPFHLNAAVKGKEGGIDCLRLVWRSHIEAGLIEDPGSDPWPHHEMQYSQNSDEEILIDYVERYTAEVETPLPGDIVLAKRGEDRVFAHGGIVTQWPKVIHVMDRRVGVVEGDARALRDGKFRFFSVWARKRS